MELNDIKALNLKQFQHVEIRIKTDAGELETKCGWFMQLMELPNGMKQIPPEYKSSYPIEPPFVEIAYKLDRNHCGKDIVQYLPEKIFCMRVLTPDLKF